MNRTFIPVAAAMIALLAQAAHAQDHSDYSHERLTARSVASVGKTRAEVKAELKDAMAKGQITHGDRDPAPFASSPSALNRVDVQREAIEANKSRSLINQDRG
jgi:hypothetical protein